MRFKKTLSIILSLAFVFSMVAGATYTYAASQSDITRLQQENEAAQQKINELKKDAAKVNEYIQALDQKIQIIKDEISALQSQAKELQGNIDSVQADIDANEAEMVRIQEEIDAKQEEFDKVYDEYCKRLRAMYVSGSVSNLEVLLTSADISSILTRSEMIKSVSRQDNKALADLTAKMEEIEKDKVSLQKKRVKLADDKAVLDEKKAELDANISEVASAKATLDESMAEANAAMQSINNSKAEYQETISENNAEMQEIAAEIRRAQQAAAASSSSSSSSGGSYSGGGGSLRYPTDSTYISAGFPNYSGGGYHGGVDFPVSTGSNVYAAASGTVIIAKTLTYSYGYYIVIDHGNGMSTLYAHNSALLVSVGQSVTKGQVIARSGSTGNSTGPHCHFEVRINGTQVNPLNYL